MKGECPENKKEKHKKIHKFKKPKAMVATWSDEDSSEKEEEEKSSSSESEQICFMANSLDGKVSTSFEDYSIEDWQDAYAELVEKYFVIRKENKHLKKKMENIMNNYSSNKRICELENEVAELNEEKENLLNLIDELKLAPQKATHEFKELSEKLEMENKDKQQKVEEIKTLENQLKEKEEVIETCTKVKDNLEALLGAKMKSISHGLGFNKPKSKKDKSGEKKDKAPLIKFVKGPSLENTEIKQTSRKTTKISKTQNQKKSTRSTQSPDRSTPVHKKKDSVVVVSTPVKERSTLPPTSVDTPKPRSTLTSSSVDTYPSQGTNISTKGSVDTPHTGVDTMLQALTQKMKKLSSSVDTRPSQVDTRGRSQRTMFTGLYNQVDTRCSQVDTRCLSQKAYFARLGQCVDTGLSQVDTRDLSQGTILPIWDSVWTHPMGRFDHFWCRVVGGRRDIGVATWSLLGRADMTCNDPRTRPSAHAEDPIFAVVAHGSRDPEGL
ncbi:hypothetical protein Taro_015168 [Colocasia esculenta]|uniref:Uncharacterized protein n=1 Tax=Colocasia esculenta TaxID=4460 RepID=A0A843UP30_COLES|nr:hypothetical protein [Colocasia esculenta]